jgi:hypothetical protein
MNRFESLAGRNCAAARVLAVAAAACLALISNAPASAQSVPRYTVAPWPKQLPNKWMLANATGLFVDKEEHIWVLQRPRMLLANDAGAAETPPTAECCVPAPSVIEFDAEGNVLKSFGGPGYLPEWPILEHGLYIDREGDFWVGGNFQAQAINQLTAPPGKPKELPPNDRHVLKLSPDGKQVLLEIGHSSMEGGMTNQDTKQLGPIANMVVDDDAHEVYIADGYLNRRIMVFDSNTGAFKRGWGAYGVPLDQIDNGRAGPYDPANPPKTFRNGIRSIALSRDGMIYVSDRGADRVQIFTKDGKFVKEYFVHPKTLGQGSVSYTILSRDPKEKYLYVADTSNGTIWILNRSDGTEVGSVGHKGHGPGELDGPECMALDAHNNLYVTEVGAIVRIQKFAAK